MGVVKKHFPTIDMNCLTFFYPCIPASLHPGFPLCFSPSVYLCTCHLSSPPNWCTGSQTPSPRPCSLTTNRWVHYVKQLHYYSHVKMCSELLLSAPLTVQIFSGEHEWSLRADHDWESAETTVQSGWGECVSVSGLSSMTSYI